MATPKKKPATAPRRRAAAKPPVPIRAVDFVMFNAKDVKKTRAFYQKLFGFKPGEEWNEGWSELATEPLTLCLNGPDDGEFEEISKGPPALALAVDDIHAAVAACRKRKVTVLAGPVETRVCWMAYIADPDGNRLCLHQRKNGTAG